MFTGTASVRRPLRVILTALASLAIVTDLAALRRSENRNGGSLSVSTDPAGANVFVDGRYTGLTPTEISGLPTGSHRVRVVKSGYLENARLVHVGDTPTTVRVRLTPDASAAGSALAGQVVSGGTRSGGLLSNKWLWIGAGIAGGGAAVALAGKKKEDAAPIVASITVAPATGLQGATVITFTAVGASDPDNDPLTYTWDFGDGSTGTGESTTHSYSTARTFPVSVKVSDGQKFATASGSVTIVSLTGTWRGNNGPYTVTITHAGSVLQVVWDDVSGGLSRRWVGMGGVSSPRNMTATLTASVNATGSLGLNGTLDAAGNALTGTVTGFSSPFNLDVRRQ